MKYSKNYNEDMYTVLNDRQNKIFNDLKNSRNPITGKTLASKYDVSLRTIRNDIQVITEFLDKVGGVIIKVPRIGMRIIDAGDESVYQSRHNDLGNFIYFDSKKQMFMIFAYFLLNKDPITIENCAELFQIAKGTFLSKVKEFNEFLKTFDVRLRSYLIEITAKILTFKDEKTGKDLIDVILNRAGQKGTGKWTSVKRSILV